MVIGYTISGDDCGAWFFRTAPDDVICPKCKTCLNYDYTPENVAPLNKAKGDVIATYDNQLLYSQKFVDFVRGIIPFVPRFVRVCTKPDYYCLNPEVSVPFDSVKRGTRFGKKCDLCGNFMWAAGARPAVLKINALPGKGFFKTDILFGGPEKGPLIIVDIELKKALERQNFKGVYFDKVYSADSPWPPSAKINLSTVSSACMHKE